MQPMSTTNAKVAWPLAAICCLGLILFVICAAVVLALIPVYLPSRSVAASINDLKSTAPFYVTFDGEAEENDALGGVGTSLDDAKASFTNSKDITVRSLSTSPSFSARRKRGMYGDRKRRDTIAMVIIIVFQFVDEDCNAQCLLARKAFQQALEKWDGNFCNFGIDGGPTGSVDKKPFKLKYKAMSRNQPDDYRPVPTSDTFTCIKNGSYNDPTIWAGGRLPSGKCKIVIPAGFVVTVPRASMRLNASAITVGGKLVLGGDSDSFTFRCPVAIRVMSGGSVEDASTSKTIVLPLGSLIQTFTGGSFCQAGTKVQTTSASGAVQTSTVQNPSGPSTIACLPSTGTIFMAPNITFIAVSSGGFTSKNTYLAGFAPTEDDCDDAACGIYILPGVTLNTADLNGVLDIDIGSFIVPLGAILQLGTPGSSDGIKFMHDVDLSIAGVLSFVASAGGIFMPPGSDFFILSGGSFTSGVVTFIQVFDPLTGDTIGSPQELEMLITEAFTLILTITGVEIVPIIPDSSSTTTTTPMATPQVNG